MYRDVPFRRLTLDEACLLIARETRRARDASRVFLADGDVMRRPFEEFVLLLQELAARLPRLARVNTYATGSAIRAKTDAQLRTLRALKLQTLYLGLESGDEETLRRVRKGETAEQMIEAGQRAQQCGLRLSVMILLGLGGRERTREHAEATACALNSMQPRLLSALRLVPVPGTELHAELQQGRFAALTEFQVVQELHSIIQNLELTNTVFRANHASNIVPVEARFPRDKLRLLTELEGLFQAGTLDRLTPGPLPLWL